MATAQRRPPPAKTAARPKTARGAAAARTAPGRETAGRKTAGRKTAGRKTAAKAAAKRPNHPAAAPAGAPRALSLHLGLNAVDPRHYAGWSGDLLACEYDANDMAAVATAEGMAPTVLLTRAATRRRVVAALRRAAKRLGAGDLFLLTYSGHGGQIPDVTSDEADRRDETWCLFDGQLIDDELYLELGRFAKGVRIVVLSDSCHSGTVTRAAVGAPAVDAAGRPARARLLPPPVADATYRANRRQYDRLQRDVSAAARAGDVVDPDAALAQVAHAAQAAADPRLGAVAARFRSKVILISGCLDNQTALDGPRNGAFTEQLLRVWADGAFAGNYARFHAAIKAGMPATQTPNLFTIGDVRSFVTQRPFQLSARPAARVTAAGARASVEAAPAPAPRRTRGASRA
jgi:hypothetical protein